jgi:hypothetical protein
MTDIELEAAFESFNEDFLKYQDIAQPLHARRDLAAMLLMESLAPSPGYPMIAGARHDEIWFQTDLSRLAQVITLEQVRDLVRCGVRVDEDSFCMFV